MMGDKKLSEVKANIYAWYAGAYKDPVQHMKRQLRKAQRKRPPDAFEIETLQSFLNTLEGQQKKQAAAPIKFPKPKKANVVMEELMGILKELEKGLSEIKKQPRKTRRKQVTAGS